MPHMRGHQMDAVDISTDEVRHDFEALIRQSHLLSKARNATESTMPHEQVILHFLGISIPQTLLLVYLVLALAAAQSLFIIIRRPWSRKVMRCVGDVCRLTAILPTLEDAGASFLVPTSALMFYRGITFSFIAILAGMQVVEKGSYVLKFYTIWNWWLLGLYFGLATYASYCVWTQEQKDVIQQQPQPSSDQQTLAQKLQQQQLPSQQEEDSSPASSTTTTASTPALTPTVAQSILPHSILPPSLNHRLHHSALPLACHALFLTTATTAAIVDLVTWTVLFPMLTTDTTPEKEAFYRAMFLNFASYNQHGFNAVLVAADLLMNRLPFDVYPVGWTGLWSLAYCGWAHFYHYLVGRWMYPFLNVEKPWAPLAYLGLYLVHWVMFVALWLAYRVKEWALLRLRSGVWMQAERVGGWKEKLQ